MVDDETRAGDKRRPCRFTPVMWTKPGEQR